MSYRNWKASKLKPTCNKIAVLFSLTRRDSESSAVNNTEGRIKRTEFGERINEIRRRD